MLADLCHLGRLQGSFLHMTDDHDPDAPSGVVWRESLVEHPPEPQVGAPVLDPTSTLPDFETV